MRNCASEVWSFGPSRNDGSNNSQRENKTGTENVGNSTSAALAFVETQVTRTRFQKTSLLRRLFALGVALGGAGQNLLGDQAGVLADRCLDLRGHIGVGLEEGF